MADQPLNQPAEIPAELDRWNWGAFLLHWIWGIGNSVFIALLMFVPLVNIVMMFVLGARGSRWAWRNRAWRDAEHFRSVQRKWAIAGVIVWVASIGLAAAAFSSIPITMKSSEAYTMTMDAIRADAGVKAALGDDVDAGFWVNGGINVEAGRHRRSETQHSDHRAVRVPARRFLMRCAAMVSGTCALSWSTSTVLMLRWC